MFDNPPEDPPVLNNKTIFEEAIAEYYSIYLAVGWHPDIVLPEFLKTPGWKANKEPIVLEYGLDMPVPISDLKVTEAGVSATLSFSREPFATFVPWAAVLGFSGKDKRPPEPPKRFKLKAV
jgi:hypothetical protein